MSITSNLTQYISKSAGNVVDKGMDLVDAGLRLVHRHSNLVCSIFAGTSVSSCICSENLLSLKSIATIAIPMLPSAVFLLTKKRAFESAINKGDLSTIRAMMIQSGFQPSLEHVLKAFDEGHTDVAKVLIQNFIEDPRIQNSRIIQALIENPSEDILNTQNTKNRTLLHNVATWENFECALKLIEDPRVNPNILDNRGRSPLHWAVNHKRFDVVQALLQNPKTLVNIEDFRGFYPLHSAFEQKSFDIVLSLIRDPRTNLNTKDKNGNTLLHLAILAGKLDIVQLLTQDKRTDLNIQTQDGKTPLHLAISMGMLDVVQFLTQDSRADLNIKDGDGCTPLHKAILANKPEIAQFLIQKLPLTEHPIPNSSAVLTTLGTDCDGSYPLQFAIDVENEEIYNMLIERGCSLFYADQGSLQDLIARQLGIGVVDSNHPFYPKEAEFIPPVIEESALA